MNMEPEFRGEGAPIAREQKQGTTDPFTGEVGKWSPRMEDVKVADVAPLETLPMTVSPSEMAEANKKYWPDADANARAEAGGE